MSRFTVLALAAVTVPALALVACLAAVLAVAVLIVLRNAGETKGLRDLGALLRDFGVMLHYSRAELKPPKLRLPRISPRRRHRDKATKKLPPSPPPSA